MGKNDGTRVNTTKFHRRVGENFFSLTLKIGCPLTETLSGNVISNCHKVYVVRYHGFDFILDEFFGIHKKLIMGFPWNKVHKMVKIISRIIRGGHGFHYVFIIMEYGRT